MQTQVVTREDVIKLVLSLPIEKLAEVYDFANFLSSRPLTASFEYTEADQVWDKALSETDSAKLQAWVDELMAEPGEVIGSHDEYMRRLK